jgi:23S rRNA (uracil1939-C5)-methyltransferase
MKLRIDKVVYGGDGLARLNDQSGSVFVPFTLPGETVEVGDIVSIRARREAPLLSVLDASLARVEPQCMHFGECGGCQYQHAAYPEQLNLKRMILAESLERAGIKELPKITIHSAEPWQYRNRIRLRIAEVDGSLRVGYLRRDSSEFLPIQMCPISSPLLWRAAQALLTLQGDATRWLRFAVEIELFTNADETKLQMTIFVSREPQHGFANLCEQLKELAPELAGAGVFVMQDRGHSRKTARMIIGITWGADGLNYSVNKETYWVSRGTFFQVNRFLIDHLVQLVTEGRRGSIAWDLYAGVGLFSRQLTKQFAKVVAVEAASGDLSRTFKGEGRIAINATTLEFLQNAILQRERPELVVVDPPRAGVGAEVCSLLVRLQPREIVYVSCDPVTLGRDLKAMIDSGYKLSALHLVDMFPQTYHQETVAVLER